MKLSRDLPIYTRLDGLSTFQLKDALEMELHCRATYEQYSEQYEINMKHFGWNPKGLILSYKINVPAGKFDYLLAIFLLDEFNNRYNPKRTTLFEIDEITVAPYKHGDEFFNSIHEVYGNDYHEYLIDINWESERRAVLKPSFSYGSISDSVRPLYLEIPTELPKKEALEYVKRAIEYLYDHPELEDDLLEVSCDYGFHQLHLGHVKKTNWADMLFIYDYIELYGDDGHKLTEKMIDELRDAFEAYGYQHNGKGELGIGPHSLSSVRNRLADIRQSIETLKSPLNEDKPKILR